MKDLSKIRKEILELRIRRLEIIASITSSHGELQRISQKLSYLGLVERKLGNTRGS